MNIELTRGFFCGAQSSTTESCWCGFWSLRPRMTGCAASMADGFGYLTSNSTLFTISGCRFTRSEFFCSTWCHCLFYGSSAEYDRFDDASLPPG